MLATPWPLIAGFRIFVKLLDESRCLERVRFNKFDAAAALLEVLIPRLDPLMEPGYPNHQDDPNLITDWHRLLRGKLRSFAEGRAT